MRRQVLTLVLALGLVACGSAGTKQPAAAPAASGSAGASTSTTTTAPSTRPFTVSRRDIVVEDTSRPTAADPNRGLAEKPSRTLPLMILAPDGPGPFPILVYSHGVANSGPGRFDFLEPIAAAGYVVIAPTFPLSSGPDGTIPDFANQPADVYFALDSVIEQAQDSSDPLHGRLDTEHIALAGHSLGAMTTIGATLNSCCSQPRVDAAIMFSGIEAGFPGGDYAQRPPMPTLLVHGTADGTLPFDGSVKLFDAATGPTAFLKVTGGTHSGIFQGDQGALLDQATIAWLDKWLRDDGAELAALPAAVDAAGIAELETKNL